jgi:[acyl-carrier-protein] S-malonyltransferase
LPSPDFVAGHSLGEYSALVASNAIAFSDAVRIVRKRGQAMQTAVPQGIGTMAAIMGVANANIENACQTAQELTKLVVVPANFNGPGQVVIAGHNEAVDVAIEILKANGCRKAVKLSVSAPFHSPLMEPARLSMESVLQPLIITAPSSPLINNIDADVVSDPEIIRNGLMRQISGAVRWEAITTLLLEQGVTQFFELGPGTVLKNLVKRQIKDRELEDTQVYSIADQNDFTAVMANLNREFN